MRSKSFKLIVLVVTLLPSVIVNAALSKGELLEYISPHDYGSPAAEAMKKEKRIYDAINADWPQASKYFEEIIYEAKDRGVLISACSILNRKMVPGQSSCRDVVFYLLNKADVNDRGLHEIATSMLGKCCTAEDIPRLLDIMANSKYLDCKEDAAVGLARVGNENTLREMERIYNVLKANEPARYEKERRGIEEGVNELRETPGAVVNIPPWKVAYLDTIASEINKLNKDLRVRPALKSQLPQLRSELATAADNVSPSLKNNCLSVYWIALWILSAIFFLLFGALSVWRVTRSARNRKPPEEE